MAEEFGIDDLAILHAHNRKMAQATIAGVSEQRRIFQDAHNFINTHADEAFARYVGIIEKHLADGVVSAEEAARLIAEALGKAQGDAAKLAGIASGGGDLSGLTPGGLGYDAVSGGKGKKGGLDGEEIRKLLAQAEKQGKGAIIDPYNGTIYLVGGGRFTKGSGTLRGRDREDYDRRYNEVAAQHGFPSAQRGAFVKGSQQGSLVRVGENFTDENITPVGGRGGSGSGVGGQTVIPVSLAGKRWRPSTSRASVWPFGRAGTDGLLTFPSSGLCRCVRFVFQRHATACAYGQRAAHPSD